MTYSWNCEKTMLPIANVRSEKPEDTGIWPKKPSLDEGKNTGCTPVSEGGLVGLVTPRMSLDRQKGLLAKENQLESSTVQAPAGGLQRISRLKFCQIKRREGGYSD
jgi:hypothetical protein